ncbi:hypothetical protein V8E36_007624 [Tilletia maclaganii]
MNMTLLFPLLSLCSISLHQRIQAARLRAGSLSEHRATRRRPHRRGEEATRKRTHRVQTQSRPGHPRRHPPTHPPAYSKGDEEALEKDATRAASYTAFDPFLGEPSTLEELPKEEGNQLTVRAILLESTPVGTTTLLTYSFPIHMNQLRREAAKDWANLGHSVSMSSRPRPPWPSSRSAPSSRVAGTCPA